MCGPVVHHAVQRNLDAPAFQMFKGAMKERSHGWLLFRVNLAQSFRSHGVPLLGLVLVSEGLCESACFWAPQALLSMF